MSETTAAPASAEGGAADPAADYDFAADQAADLAPETAATTAEPAQEQADAQDDLPPDNRPVSAIWAELKRTRERAQRAEQEAKQRAEEAERHRLAALRVLEAHGQRQQPQPQQPEVQIPDVETDPVGHFKARMEAAERRLQAVAQPIVAQQHEAQFANTVRAHVQQFAAQTPDYQPAYQHAWGVMERMAASIGTTPQQIERMIAAQALQAGRNPGQAVYEFAKAAGYTGPQPAKAPEPPADQVMQTLERGAQAARSVGGGGGRTPPRITLEAIANMSPREYADLERRHPELIEQAFQAAG